MCAHMFTFSYFLTKFSSLLFLLILFAKFSSSFDSFVCVYRQSKILRDLRCVSDVNEWVVVVYVCMCVCACEIKSMFTHVAAAYIFRIHPALPSSSSTFVAPPISLLSIIIKRLCSFVFFTWRSHLHLFVRFTLGPCSSRLNFAQTIFIWRTIHKNLSNFQRTIF